MNTFIQTKYDVVSNGFIYNIGSIKEELEYRGQVELTDSVLSIVKATATPKRQLRELGVNKWVIEDILENREVVYNATPTDTFYTIDGIDNSTVQRVKYNPETGVGTAEVKEVSYTYDYDIDQEVYDCDDRECVRNVVTDTYETECVSEYEINILVDLTGGQS